MLLREDFRYVVLDTETTGVDKKNDELTQIALVEYNWQWKELQRFSSYIKTQTSIQPVVSMLTWISKETLEDAPSWEEVKEKVKSFLWENTVIIGHSVWFDIDFLSRYLEDEWGVVCYTSIDTLSLSQALFPYQQSYALEILAQNLLPPSDKTNYHDALTDTLVTGDLFFASLKKLESLLYSFPYLREIFKRTKEGLAKCLSYNGESQYLLKEVPILSSPILQEKKIPTEDIIPEWTRYIGKTSLESTLKTISIDAHCLAFSHHSKALLTQKQYAKVGTLTPLYEQTAFDSHLLHKFFTKKEYLEWEVYCATKYFLHAREWHGSFHAANAGDTLFLNACRLQTPRSMRKKLFTHHDLFEAIHNDAINREQTLLLFDKERLLEGWSKRKYKPYDFYTLSNKLQALLYKNELLEKDTKELESIHSAILIFIWYFTDEAEKLEKDLHKELPTQNNQIHISVADFQNDWYFFKSSHIRKNIQEKIENIAPLLSPYDFSILEKEQQKVDQILNAPFSLTRKRSNYQTWFTIQSDDTFVERDDILHFFETYHIRILTALDPRFPKLPWTQTENAWVPIAKRKDISLRAGERVCIIAPGKAAAQQLILSLHNSKAYDWFFLGAEHVTWGSGKIIQQTIGKNKYILIWWYNFCIQCVANWIKFDSIGALDIIEWDHINPFTDLWYYAGEKNK